MPTVRVCDCAVCVCECVALVFQTAGCRLSLVGGGLKKGAPSQSASWSEVEAEVEVDAFCNFIQK